MAFGQRLLLPAHGGPSRVGQNAARQPVLRPFAAVSRTFMPASGALFEKSLTEILALPHGSQGMN